MFSASKKEDQTDMPLILVKLFDTYLMIEKPDLCDWKHTLILFLV